MRPFIVATLACVLALPAAASASPGSGPTTAVSLGDSYISGEAGRWQGNSLDPSPGNSGTDRAKGVYGSSGPCHRSDTAEILSSSLPVAERVNIACSGGVTKNVFRASSGGEGQNGEAPQSDQLLGIAKAKDVRFVFVSVGGNDLGFSSIVAACLQAYVAKTGPCRPSQQPRIDAGRAKVVADVEKAIDEVRATMTQAGYTASDYRLILQTYPSVIPRASEARIAESDQQRTTQGCPFYDEDLTWARTMAAPEIGGTVKEAATARGVEVLDLIDAFQGHEFCAKTTREATPLDKPAPPDSEWGRFVGGSTVQQGDLQEAFHPNAYGQRAFGACLTQVAAQAPGEFRCTGAAGETPEQVRLTTTRTFPAAAKTTTAAKPRLALSVSTSRRGGRTCAAFRVRTPAGPVRRANIRLASRLARTDKRGRATICVRLRHGRRYTATAHRTGFRSDRRVLRGR